MLSLRVSPFRSAQAFRLALRQGQAAFAGRAMAANAGGTGCCEPESTKPTPTVEGISEVIDDYIENWRPYLYTALRWHWHDPTILGRMRRVHGRERCLCFSVS